MSPVPNRSGTSGFEPAARFYGSCSSHSAIVPYVCQTATSGKRKKGESINDSHVSNCSLYYCILEAEKTEKTEKLLFF